MKIERYLDPNQEGSGGNGIDPIVKVETEKYGSYLSKGYDNLTDTEKKEFDTFKEKYEYQELDKEGKPLTEEAKKQIKETQDKIKAIELKAEKDRTVDETKFLADNLEVEEVDVYKQVDELNGFSPEVDYGTADPKSAEGIAKRESSIVEAALKDYDDELKEKFPRAYQYFLHVQNGGKDDDFF